MFITYKFNSIQVLPIGKNQLGGFMYQLIILVALIQSCASIQGTNKPEAKMNSQKLDSDLVVNQNFESTNYEITDHDYIPYDPSNLWISFRVGSYRLNPKAQKTLQRIIAGMKQDPLVRILVKTHADPSGSWAANRDLSRKRALSVQRYLVAYGIEGTRLKLDWVGETDYPGDDPRRSARRAEFFRYYDSDRYGADQQQASLTP